MKRECTLSVLALALFLVLVPAVRAEQWTGGDLTLERAVALALERNLGYATANLTAESATSATRQSGDKLQPQVTVGGTYDRQLADEGSGPQVTVTATQQYVGLAPALAVPGHPLPLGPVALAKLAEEQARGRADEARQTLVFNVTQAYFNVLKAARLKDVQRAALASSEAARKDTSAKVTGGTATRVDLLKAEMGVANAELAVLKADNAYATAESAFFTLLALDPPATPIAYAPAPETPEPDGTLEALTTQALERRSDVADARLALDKAVSQQNQAELAALPTLTLDAGLSGEKYDLSSSWEPVTGTLSWEASAYTVKPSAPGSSRTSSASDDWTIGVSVTYPLYNAGVLRESALQAKLQTAQAKNTLEQSRAAAAMEVQTAWQELQEAKLTVGTARKAVGQSAEALRLTRLRVDNGVGTPADLLEAIATDLQTQVSLVQAEYAQQLAVVKLKKAVGLL
ncbi:MAG: TolC family protein [Methanocella sp.]